MTPAKCGENRPVRTEEEDENVKISYLGHFETFGGAPLGPPMGAPSQFEHPLPLRMTPAKCGENWPVCSEEKDENIKFSYLGHFEAFGGAPLGPPWGHHPHLNKLRSPPPKDDSCQVW